MSTDNNLDFSKPASKSNPLFGYTANNVLRRQPTQAQIDNLSEEQKEQYFARIERKKQSKKPTEVEKKQEPQKLVKEQPKQERHENVKQPDISLMDILQREKQEDIHNKTSLPLPKGNNSIMYESAKKTPGLIYNYPYLLLVPLVLLIGARYSYNSLKAKLTSSTSSTSSTKQKKEEQEKNPKPTESLYF